jgi:hypothetical protein
MTSADIDHAGMRRLAQAIIGRAVLDITGTRDPYVQRRAILFLTSGADLQLWADIAGFDATAIRRAVESGKITEHRLTRTRRQLRPTARTNKSRFTQARMAQWDGSSVADDTYRRERSAICAQPRSNPDRIGTATMFRRRGSTGSRYGQLTTLNCGGSTLTSPAIQAIDLTKNCSAHRSRSWPPVLTLVTLC